MLVSGTMLCLIQIWLPEYYLTCDGPCHLYNASVVHDLWTGSNRDFYNFFYKHVYSIDPNSLTTYALALLLFIAKAAAAEKIFLTAYVLIYTSGFVLLMRKISGGSDSSWLVSGFICIFTYALSKGFYNFSFGVAVWLWMIWAWLRYMDKPSIARLSFYSVITAVTFFTHLLPFTFGLITTAALVGSCWLAGKADNSQSIKTLVAWGLAAAPLVIFTLLFTQKEGGLQLHLAAHPYRLVELVEFKYIINVVDKERAWAIIAGVAISTLVIVAILQNAKKFRWHRYDGFFAALVVITFVYMFFPEDFLGRAIIISIRAQLFVMLLATLIIGYRLNDGVLKKTGAAILLSCFVVLSVIRINCRQDANSALKGVISAGKMITDRTVVLPVNGNPGGERADGTTIADRNALFHHATHYIACGRPIIMLDNYEANTGYFPIRWRYPANPYIHLSLNGGFEKTPPVADIDNYERISGRRINYVIARSCAPFSEKLPADLAGKLTTEYSVIFNDNVQKVILLRKSN